MNFNDEIKDLQEGLEDFLEDGEYTVVEIRTCISLIEKFLVDLDNSEDKQEGDIHIKKVVTALNELNNNCGDTLIETDQREVIAGIINDASRRKNYSSEDQDVTEEFREW